MTLSRIYFAVIVILSIIPIHTSTVEPSPEYHAFHDGKHYYIPEWTSSNPDSDTTGIIEESAFT